jgi:hypothetical protein
MNLAWQIASSQGLVSAAAAGRRHPRPATAPTYLPLRLRPQLLPAKAVDCAANHKSNFPYLVSTPSRVLHLRRRSQRKSNVVAASSASSSSPVPPWLDLDASPGLGPPRPRRDAASSTGLTSLLHRITATVFPFLESAELARRLLVTMCMLCLFRIGYYIQIPGEEKKKRKQGIVFTGE